MGESKLGTTVRNAIKAIFQRRKEKRLVSVARFTPVPRQRRRLSRRGEPGDTWNTKQWTKCRIRNRTEALEMRRKMIERDRAEKAEGRATYVEAHG